MEKKVTLTVEIKEANTPQNWIFTKDCSGIDQLAMWVIIKHLAEKNISKFLGCLLFIMVIGCSEKKEIKPLSNNKGENRISSTSSPIDTIHYPVVRQELWRNDSTFYVHTYILFNKYSKARSISYGGYAMGWKDYFTPYDVEIGGSFEYIKSIKKSQLKKAKLYLSTKEANEKRLDSQLQILKQLK